MELEVQNGSVERNSSERGGCTVSPEKLSSCDVQLAELLSAQWGAPEGRMPVRHTLGGNG